MTIELTPLDTRILGCLIEKEITRHDLSGALAADAKVKGAQLVARAESSLVSGEFDAAT